MLRSTRAAALWLAAVSLVIGVQGAPNYQLSSSSIGIPSDVNGQHSKALESGEIVVRVQRIDDIFSGDIQHLASSRLLLEKKTHVVLRVSLDQAQQTVKVNNEPVYRHFEGDQATDTVQPVSVVKAETYTLPDTTGEAPLTAQEAHALLTQLSPGIVGVEVKVELKPLSMDTPLLSEMVNSDQSLLISLRQLGLSIRVIESEEQEIPAHVSTAFVPVLQLVLHTDSVDGVSKIVKVQTLHIGDAITSTIDAISQQSNINEAISQIGPLGPIIVNAETFPELEPMMNPEVTSRVRKGGCRFRKGPHSGLFETHPITSGIFDWLHSLFFGENRHFDGGEHRHHLGREGHAMMAENPFTGLMEKVGSKDDADSIGLVQDEELPRFKQGLRRPHRHHGSAAEEAEYRQHHDFHHHGQGMHPHGPHRWRGHAHGRRFHRFFHRVAIGFVYGMALVMTLLMHPAVVYGTCVLALGGVAFFVARRMTAPSADGSIRLIDNSDAISIDSKDTIIIDIGATDNDQTSTGDKLPTSGYDEKQ